MIDWSEYFDWTYSGVNTSLPSSGGPICVGYLTRERKIAESLVFCVMALVELFLAWRRISLPKNVVKPVDRKSLSILLALLGVTFGIEIGFKLATRQFIWLLNPCHLITIAQIFLMAAPPCKLTTVIFRMHLYYLIGPLEALLIPVTYSRMHVFEKEIYFVQHFLILIVPYYLFKSKGMYVPEPLSDLGWPLLAFGSVFLFHFTALQYLSIVTEININNIICPATADPFRGPWYRVAAVSHQTFLMLIMGKFYPQVAAWLARSSWSDLVRVFQRRSNELENFVKSDKNFQADHQMLTTSAGQPSGQKKTSGKKSSSNNMIGNNGNHLKVK